MSDLQKSIDDLSAQSKAAAEVSAYLVGSCNSLSQALETLELPAELEDDVKFCAALDAEVFCCSDCGWWSSDDELHDEDGDQLCHDCADNRASDQAE
jgi:hypothetical protein